jgi:hypothetical protein
LLIFAPGIVPVNRRVKNLVRSIDIFPTILTLLNIKIDSINFDGRNLLPLLKNDKSTENWAYSENIPKGLISVRTSNLRLVVGIGIKESNDKFKIRPKHFDLFDIKKGSSIKGKKIPDELMKRTNKILSELENSINIARTANSNEEAMIYKHLISLGYI